MSKPRTEKTLNLTLTYPQLKEFMIFCMNNEGVPELDPILVNLTLTYPQFKELMIFCMDNEGVPELEQLHRKLDEKLNKLMEHYFYTKSKTAPTDEEREKARQEYLNRKGIPQSFRW